MSGGASAGSVEGWLKSASSLSRNGCVSAEELDQACGIVLDAEGGLPGVGLGVVAPLLRVAHLDGIEGRGPLAVCELGPHEADGASRSSCW